MSGRRHRGTQPWYRLLDRSQWNTLIASNLGWMFDGYETFALVMSVGVALHQLLEPSQYPQIPVYAGSVIALTLLGWGIGGLIGGVLADYLGRKRTMMLAILAYSIMTGLSRLRLGLGVVRGAAVPGRPRDRLRMGHRHLDRLRAVAGPGARQAASG